jgi:hypothetical protein
VRERSMTTPDGSTGSCQRSPVADIQRPQGDLSDAGLATTPGLVVTEERLPDGRAITYFGISR